MRQRRDSRTTPRAVRHLVWFAIVASTPGCVDVLEVVQRRSDAATTRDVAMADGASMDSGDAAPRLDASEVAVMDTVYVDSPTDITALDAEDGSSEGDGAALDAFDASDASDAADAADAADAVDVPDAPDIAVTSDGGVRDGSVSDGSVTDAATLDGSPSDGFASDVTTGDGSVHDGSVTDVTASDGFASDNFTPDANTIDVVDAGVTMCAPTAYTCPTLSSLTCSTATATHDTVYAEAMSMPCCSDADCALITTDRCCGDNAAAPAGPVADCLHALETTISYLCPPPTCTAVLCMPYAAQCVSGQCAVVPSAGF